MAESEREQLISRVLANPLRWRADSLARRLNLTEAERRRLRITTIGAVDLDKAARLKRRRELSRQIKAAARQAKGAASRAYYEAQSLSRTKPWHAQGISRRTWYRRRGTSAVTAQLPIGCFRTCARPAS
jgi:hypothetical protein